MTISRPDTDLDIIELGAVTDRSARLWVRLRGYPRVVAVLTAGNGAVARASAALCAGSDWTAALDLALAKPAPATRFSIEAAGRRIDGSFAPSPGERAELTFGFGSCHQPFVQRKDGSLERKRVAAIYGAFKADLERQDARLLLLVGDQVYTDGVPALDVREATGRGDAAALEAYWRVYHHYFAEPGMAALRSHGPTLCLWDDHDILDNWGSRGDNDRAAPLFRAACRAYERYQHARNPALDPEGKPREAGNERREEETVQQRAPATQGPPYPFAYVYGDIAFLGLDLRGARDADAGTLLGAEQWRRIEGFLAGEQARMVATLFVICTVPLAHPARWLARLLERAPDPWATSVRDRWSSRAFLPERDRLLAALFKWQAAGAARQVCVLSGDIHTGGVFVLRQRRGPGVIHQFISSALTSELTRVQRFGNLVGSLLPALGEPDITIARRWLVFRRNYGLVRVQPLAAGGHQVEFILKAWSSRRRRARTGGRAVAMPASR